MATLKTYLISGAGNTFHIAWNQTATNPAEISKKICETNTADGFIFLSQDTNGIYKWDFYNNDGSAAEMCGNATRCVGYFAKNILKNQSADFQLQTIAGAIRISPNSNEQFTVHMTAIQEFSHPSYFYCDTGVPHIVIEHDKFNQYRELKSDCSKLRFHPDFLPRGTNVTLIQKTTVPEIVKAVSYERGVEDFTLACGTGAVAAAFYNFKKYHVSITQVEMPGGVLKMDLNDLNKPTMQGPAVLIGEFQYENI